MPNQDHVISIMNFEATAEDFCNIDPLCMDKLKTLENARNQVWDVIKTNVPKRIGKAEEKRLKVIFNEILRIFNKNPNLKLKE